MTQIPRHWKPVGFGIYHDPDEEALHLVLDEMLDHFGWPHTPEYEAMAQKAFAEAVRACWPKMRILVQGPP